MGDAKFARTVKQLREARSAQERAKQTAMSMMSDRNVICTALLQQHGRPIVLTKSALDEAGARAHAVRFDQSQSRMLATPKAIVVPGLLRRILNAITGKVLATSADPEVGISGGPVLTPVLTIRWATPQELEAAQTPPPAPAPPPPGPVGVASPSEDDADGGEDDEETPVSSTGTPGPQ